MGPNPCKEGASGWFDDRNSLILNSHLFSFSFGVVPFFYIWTWILAVTWGFSLPRSVSFPSPSPVPMLILTALGKHFISLF